MPRPSNYRKTNYNPLVLIIGALLLIAIVRNNSASIFAANPITVKWNLQDPDITTNGNVLRALLLLQTKAAPAPESPKPSAILANPSNYYGKYLQLYGTIKSIRAYTPDNNLESMLIGNYTEATVIAGDNSTLIDCFLIGMNSTLSPGTSITLYGYCPGIRYLQNTQGIISELAFVGQSGTPSTSYDQSAITMFPISQNPISPNYSNP